MLPLLLLNNLWWDHFHYSGTLPNFPISNDYCSDICRIVLKSTCVGGICCLTTKLMKTGNWTTSVAWTSNKNTDIFICVFQNVQNLISIKSWPSWSWWKSPASLSRFRISAQLIEHKYKSTSRLKPFHSGPNNCRRLLWSLNTDSEGR